MLYILPIKQSIRKQLKMCDIKEATHFGVYEQKESNINNYIALFKKIKNAMIYANTFTKR